MSFIVTGGAGFIGSNFVNYLAKTVDEDIIVVDNFTYASNEDNLDKNDNVRVVQCDITTESYIFDDLVKYNSPKAVFHFAAESHVDNSINLPSIFVQTNVVGTMNLLQSVKSYSPKTRFVHISTDEVYGALTEDGPSFLETKILEPNNVYSASKAGADLLVRSYNKTFGLDTVVTRCSNNYGPRQHTEKLLPKVISNALSDIPIPVYGKGNNVREWIYVEDHCKCILTVYNKGESGEIYNIGSGIEVTNLDLVKSVLSLLDKPFSLIEFVKDRAGHDFRYSIDNSKFMALTDQYKFTELDEGLKQTVEWYKRVL
jgi:dTDP-glucose 4,6-dehydratase